MGQTMPPVCAYHTGWSRDYTGLNGPLNPQQGEIQPLVNILNIFCAYPTELQFVELLFLAMYKFYLFLVLIDPVSLP